MRLIPMSNNNNEVNYTYNTPHIKHIVVDKIRFIGKESNNIDEVNVFGIDDDTYLEYDNNEAFLQWVLTLKPNEVKILGKSEIEMG